MRLLDVAAFFLAATLATSAAAAVIDKAPDFATEPASAAARFAVASILASADAAGHSFAVVDKADAHLYIFDAKGRLQGSTPVLLGQQVGDDTVPGVGNKAPSQVLPFERTTPAGRFKTVSGRNIDGDSVIWVDYNASFAIHRVRAGASYAARMQRLQAKNPSAHRVSLGCVVVDSNFFDHVVWPAFGHGSGLVYVLPETRPVASLFAKPPLALAKDTQVSLAR